MENFFVSQTITHMKGQPDVLKSPSKKEGIDENDFNFIFLHGLRVRSGTNYLGRFFSKHPHVQSMPPDKTNNEFPLLYHLPKWRKAFESFNNNSFGSHNLFSFNEFLPYLGQSWLKYIVNKFPYRPGPIFIKAPNVENLEHFFKMFPNAKLILLYRDGRDNVSSCCKGSLSIRRTMSWKKIIKSRINYYSLRSFINFCRQWKSSVLKVLEFDSKFKDSIYKDRYMIIKYEDIVDDPVSWGRKIFSFCELEVNEDILSNLVEIEVMGSSFLSLDGDEKTTKTNWVPIKATDKFKPVGRWKSWSALQKKIFKYIAGKELIKLGYAKDQNW